MFNNSYNPFKKMRGLLLNGLILVLAVAILPACDDDDDPTSSDDEVGTIVEVASADDNFSDLVSALSDAGLASTLEGNGPFTVFAPTNEAFANLTVDLSSLTNDQLTEVLSYHVLGAEVESGDLQPEQAVDALDGGQLFVTVSNGNVTVNNNATVTDADIDASNGVIHAIDEVLLPDSYLNVVGVVSKRYMLETLVDAVVQANLVSTLEQDTQDGYTVFAPDNNAFSGVDISGLSQQELQDILTYHVLPSEVLSGDITSGTVQTVNGATVDITVAGDGTVTLTDQAGNTSTVTTVDLQGTNGVVHIIDGVLSPTQ